MIKQHQKFINLLLVVIDWISIVLSLVLAYWIRFTFFTYMPGHLELVMYLLLLVLIIPEYTVFFRAVGLYRPKRNKAFTGELLGILKADMAGTILLLTFLYLIHQGDYSRLCLFIFSFLLLLLMSAERLTIRLVLRKLRKSGYNLKYVLLVGSSQTAVDFVKKVKDSPDFGYRFYGCITDHLLRSCRLDDVPVLGDIHSIDCCLKTHRVDEVVVALALDEYHKLPDIIASCEKFGVKISVIPGYFPYIPSRPLWDEFEGMPVMTLRKIPLNNIFSKLVKRCFDLVAASLGMIFFSPLMLMTALMIRITTKESAIYKQERLGLDCKPFVMYKFRTMKTAEAPQWEWTKQYDSRRTGLGVWLRKFSIDELPQFINVIKGDMSIVGPRPEIECFANRFSETIPRYMVKHQVKPGITGWAQIQGLRGDTSIERRIKSDIYYIENWDLLLDLKIIFHTIVRAFYNVNE